ncbi:MAG: hypothetical protein ISS57_00105 [Anaerolineales bacterium]|nr:hypothetical protein [Anaerolineales bacterium]
MNIEVLNYKGWANSLRLSNHLVDLVILTEIGPRIIRYGFLGEDNLFVELSETLGHKGGNTWHVYGGHRLSHAPQADPRSHYPDNFPVEYIEKDGFLQVVQSVEPTNGIQKELDIYLDAHSTKVTVVHRLYNRNLWPVELAPWALSAMSPGGMAVAPLPPRGTHHDDLQPTGCVSLWAYTDMSDSKWKWGREYIFLSQDTKNQEPQKAGFWVPAGWTAYHWGDVLFIKQFEIKSGKYYPDKNVNVEFYTDHSLLEVETLGPLTCVEPDQFVEHVETWSLHKGVPAIETESSVRHAVTPLLSNK